MRCDDAQAYFPDHLARTLPPATAEELVAHLSSCSVCATEFAAMEETWQQLRALPAAAADSPTMRSRFERGMQDFVLSQRSSTSARANFLHYGRQFVAAAALLLLGVMLGRQSTPAAVPDPQIAELRGELRSMREMVTLSLLQQQSASERLKGVAWSSELEQPDVTVTSALLDTLMHDPNANVRLRTVDALKRFAEREDVRRGALEALAHQTNPMVQMALIDFVVDNNGRAAADVLKRIAEDPMNNETVRARATRGLQQVG